MAFPSAAIPGRKPICGRVPPPPVSSSQVLMAELIDFNLTVELDGSMSRIMTPRLDGKHRRLRHWTWDATANYIFDGRRPRALRQSLIDADQSLYVTFQATTSLTAKKYQGRSGSRRLGQGNNSNTSKSKHLPRHRERSIVPDRLMVRDVVLQINGGSHVLRSDWAPGRRWKIRAKITWPSSNGSVSPARRCGRFCCCCSGLIGSRTAPSQFGGVKRWVTSENFGAVTAAVLSAFQDGVPPSLGALRWRTLGLGNRPPAHARLGFPPARSGASRSAICGTSGGLEVAGASGVGTHGLANVHSPAKNSGIISHHSNCWGMW